MDALNQLSDLIEQRADREHIYQQICLTAAELVPNANLLSLWTFNSEQTKIQNIQAYDVAEQHFSVMDDLLRTASPEYFSAIVEHELVVAHDARTHSMTRCLKTDYLEPNHIFSLLGFILHKDSRPTGVICCESKHKSVLWSQAEQDNLRMLAVMISYYFTI